MKVYVTHSKPKNKVVEILDQPLSVLFAHAIEGLEIVDERRTWTDSTMAFSFTGRVGFISVPLSGAMDVQETLVIVDVELPPMVKMFVGEEEIRAGLEKEILILMARS